MPFVILVIGAVIIVSAFQGTQGTLASQLETDVPGYLKWALAIFAILALGWIPGLRVPSRYLLALVMTVIIVRNYQTIITGFQNIGSQVASATAPSPSNVAASPATSGGGQALLTNPLSSVMQVADLANIGGLIG